MSKEPKTYEIRTVEDFLKVPPERLELCHKEFGQWLTLVSIHSLFPGIIKSKTDCFVWIDDDLGLVHLKAEFVSKDKL